MGGALDVYTQLTGLQVQAKLLARRGESSEARSTIERAERLAMTTESPFLKGDIALAHAEVLHLSGDDDGAHAAISRAIEHYRQKGSTAYVAHAERVEAAWNAQGNAVPGH